MSGTSLGISPDLGPNLIAVTVGLSVLAAALLVFETWKQRGKLVRSAGIAVSGFAALAMLLLAIARPARITGRETLVGPKVIVLSDLSRSMALTDGESGATRATVRDRAIADLRARNPNARFVPLGFSSGDALPVTASDSAATGARSDLRSALRSIARSADERPAAVVIVSDGQFDDPPEGSSDASLRGIAEIAGVPLHGVATTRTAPDDASIRRISTTGSAVAHVPIPLRIDVGCSGSLACDKFPVTVRELRERGPAVTLATATATLRDGRGTVDVPITLERAGSRIVEVSIEAPSGDSIAQNNRRFVTIHVARERVRLLHVAGRPTHDTRTLRQWLKGNASVDVVAFFILRTPTDNPQASQDDLALIPFPVDELFSEHLPSFDAVVLQDFDAQPYGLERHLPNLASYVRAGGGLIMVGGPNSFVAGGYANTQLAGVLPVALDTSAGATAADVASFQPRYTEIGRAAPMLAPLRAIVGTELPEMPGANVLGDVRPGGAVLWTHASRTTPSGAPMPALAIGEFENGRSIALAVDGTWMLQFSALGSKTSGRGFNALWDGLLGWLMRDPKYEPAQLELKSACTAGVPQELGVSLSIPSTEKAEIEIVRIDGQKGAAAKKLTIDRGLTSRAVAIGELSEGAYTALLRIGSGLTTRLDFACEAGGDEWADPRPDPDRMRAIARASGGTFVFGDGLASISLPKPIPISTERNVTPLAPAWVWTLLAAAIGGLHWLIRRREGLS